MKQATINKLLEFANTAFDTREAPDKFARAAAHEAASAAAAAYPELLGECADAAALVAATDFVCKTTSAASFSAQVADIATQKFTNDRRYNHARDTYATSINQMGRTAEPPPHCLSMVNTMHVAASQSEAEVAASYEAISTQNITTGNKAKRAAFYVYADTYTSARSAYVRAMFISNQTKDPKKRSALFKATMSSRLHKDLNYDKIPPGFFLQLMCSTSLRIIAGLMLIAGIVAIVLGTCGIASLPLVPMVVTGSSSTALATGCLIGSFFARRQHKKLDEANQNRMDISI